MADKNEHELISEKAELYRIKLLIKHYENVIVQLVPDSTEWTMIFTTLLALKLEEETLEAQLQEKAAFEEKVKEVITKKE